MKRILTEYYPLVLTPDQLHESADQSAGKKPMIIKKVLLQRKESKNRNGRIYPGRVLEREIAKYNDDFVKSRRALAELDHSNETVVNLKNVSHLITEMWWEGNDVYGTVEVLNSPEFPAGRIMAGLLERKIPVGISSRGLGSIEDTNEGSIVQDDFALLCFDAVSFESTQGSNMSLMEGLNLKEALTRNSIDDIIHEMICLNSGACSCMFK